MNEQELRAAFVDAPVTKSDLDRVSKSLARISAEAGGLHSPSWRSLGNGQVSFHARKSAGQGGAGIFADQVAP